MNAISPKQPIVSASKRHRTTMLLSLLLLMAAIFGWDYWTLTCYDNSLARLQAELERRQALKVTLPRHEVVAFLSGFPKRISETGAAQTDFYSWRGLIHHRHLSVAYDATEAVVKVDEEEDIPQLMDDGKSLLSQKSAQPQVRKFSQEEVADALARAEQFFRKQGPHSVEFQDALRGIFEGLPELKVSTVKGELTWNSFEIPREKQRLFAFRFTAPKKEPVDLDYVRWVSIIEDDGIIPARGNIQSLQSVEPNLERNRFDKELKLEVEGLGRLDHAGFGSRSLKEDWPNQDFILWFYTGDSNPTLTFQLKTLLFLSDSGQSPMRHGVHEVSDHIGLRTNIPRIAATPDGVRDAVRALDYRFSIEPIPFGTYAPNWLLPPLQQQRRFSVEPIPLGTFYRMLHPVMKILPEVTVNTKAGEARWQKVDFPHGRFAAVRVRIPEALGAKVDLYGAILGAQPCQFGLHCHDWLQNGIRLRPLPNAPVGDPLPNPTNVLTLFSQTEDDLEPGTEIVLVIFQFDNILQPNEPMFVTLTAVPHEKSFRGSWPRLNADDQPWSCGKILGIESPKPLEPTGCRVLGWHECNMTHLAFSPSSRRLLSVDLRGDTRVWDVESEKLESEFLDGKLKLAYDNADSVAFTPDGQNLLTFGTDRRDLSGWALSNREQLFTRDVGAAPGENLKSSAFGPQPNQLAMVLQKGFNLGALGETIPPARFVRCDLDSGKVTESQVTVAREAGQLVYLPVTELFAVAFSHHQFDPAAQREVTTTTIDLYSADLSKLIQQLPLGVHQIGNPEQAYNPVKISVTPDSRRLAAIDLRGQLKVWDVTTWTELLSKTVAPLPPRLREQRLSAPALSDVSIAPNGETVATTSPEGIGVNVWNISTGLPEQRWKTDGVEVTHITHSPDGKWVATTNTDGVIRLWKNAP